MVNFTAVPAYAAAKGYSAEAEICKVNGCTITFKADKTTELYKMLDEDVFFASLTIDYICDDVIYRAESSIYQFTAITSLYKDTSTKNMSMISAGKALFLQWHD